MLEAFLVDWLPRQMYNRRAQWSGGEFGNGLEMWRRLFIEYHGGNEAVEYGGIRRLQEFPRCIVVARLSELLDDWMDVRTTNNKQIIIIRNNKLMIIITMIKIKIINT